MLRSLFVQTTICCEKRIHLSHGLLLNLDLQSPTFAKKLHRLVIDLLLPKINNAVNNQLNALARLNSDFFSHRTASVNLKGAQLEFCVHH